MAMSDVSRTGPESTAFPTPTPGPAPSLMPGRILAGRYRVCAFLGRGSVGEVYEAEDLEENQRIALKILRPEIAREEGVVRRFKREILLTRRVIHPNVCRTYDLIDQQTSTGELVRVFLTLELLRGETLEDLILRQGALRPAEALPIVRQITGALAAAHEAGVIHRDLKSANVFLVSPPTQPENPPRAVVTDFGLAWSAESDGAATLTATGELIGSPAYMAPEQVRGETASPATDVYALGVVLFEMLTGHLPFLGKSAFHTALQRLREPAPSPRTRVPDLDPVWEAVILRCLEREPGDRFGAVGEVARALEGTGQAATTSSIQGKPAAWG
jgi:serine/threonine protein kinase